MGGPAKVFKKLVKTAEEKNIVKIWKYKPRPISSLT